jgi:acyl carrier protein
MAAVVSRTTASAPNGLKGVFHCAAHYDDAALEDLTSERFTAVLAPKITGAALLGELTEDHDLDHFVLYSSIASLLGNRLQAAYGAANLYLEALARQRRRTGRPAVAVAWGPIADTGVVARSGIADSLSGLGLDCMTPGDGLNILGELLAGQPPECVVIARADWHRLRDMFPSATAARFSRLVDQRSDQRAGGAAGLRDRLRTATPAQAQDLAVQAITVVLAGIMRIPPERLPAATPLDRLGVDSLLATEISVNLRRSLGFDIPILEILSSQGLAELGRRLVSTLSAGHSRAGARR